MVNVFCSSGYALVELGRDHWHQVANWYLDPGTGSLLIQGLIATAVTVPFILRRRIGAVIGRARVLTRRGPRVDPPVQG